MDDFQNAFVTDMVAMGISHDIAMQIADITHEVRERAFMAGYDRGYNAAKQKNKDLICPLIVKGVNHER